MNILEALRDVAKWRDQVAMEESGLILLEERLKATEEYKEVERAKESIKLGKTILIGTEAVAKELAQQVYLETGEKRPAEGVLVKAMRRVIYDLSESLTWAKSEAPAYLKLDTATFEKAVREGLLPTAPARVEEYGSATLASDLSKHLPSEPTDGIVAVL